MAILFRCGAEVRVLPASGQSLLDLALQAGFPLEATCGGTGQCGRCTVFLEEGRYRACEVPLEVEPGERRPVLACTTRPDGDDARVLVPAVAALEAEGAGIEQGTALPPHARRPALTRERRAGQVVVHDVLHAPPRPLEPGWPAAGPLIGVAVDLGTTTVVAQAVDLEAGRVLAGASRFNQQLVCGADVAARVARCAREGGRATLQGLAVSRTLNPILLELAARLALPPEAFGVVTVAGNTVMQHLLLGLDPGGLGVWPFTPATRDYPPVRAAQLGLAAAPGAWVHLLPAVAGYVGGDLVADLLVTDLAEPTAGPTLLVDLGTNGELVLAVEGRLSACATAAGPAFEGGGLAQGCRAVRGAIERLDPDPARGPDALGWSTLGDAPPIGFCGSAVVDFMAAGLGAGWLGPLGRFDLERLRGSGRLAAATARGGHAHAYRVVEAARSGLGEELLVTERDVAEVMKAKGAIYAGLKTLLAREGLRPADLERVVLAGGFARHLRLENAMAIGLLPRLPRERFETIGNGALAGAVLALLDAGQWPRARGLIDRPQVVDLNRTQEFAGFYVEALALPYLEPGEFPP